MVKFPSIPLDQIIAKIGGEVCFNRFEKNSSSSALINEIGEPSEAGPSGICFLISPSFQKEIAHTRAGVLVVQEALYESVRESIPSTVGLCIKAKDAYVAFAQVSELIARNTPFADWKNHGNLPIHASAKIHSSVSIGANVMVGESTTIGARTTLLPNVSVGANVMIGEDCQIFPGAVIYPNVRIGNRVRIHANVVIGSDGFGYARGAQGAVKIWHLGSVIIQDDVEIGAGTTVDKGTIKDTVIERGTKIDNQVQIGHNVYVKAHATLCAQVGLAGNGIVGMGSILAGKVGVGDKIEIGDGAIIGAMSGVSKDVAPKDIIMGAWLARPRKEWWKMNACVERLPELMEKLKKMERAEGKKNE